MSYDLNILCINQRNVSKLPFNTTIESRNEFDSPYDGRYGLIWPFMCSLQGIWYFLGKEEDGWFNNMSIVTADFDKILDQDLRPFWISDEGVLSNLSPLIVFDEYKGDFENIIQFFIQQSPSKTIMFLARYQCGDTEIIEGVLQYKEFIELLSQRKILFNVCYIIRE